MLRTSGPPSNPELQRIVHELLREDLNFDRTDNRSTHRDTIVRPVVIDFRDCDETIAAVSRNISANGIGLITDKPIDNQTVAILRISKLTGKDETILSECRWSKAYGANWFLSGWQFINLKR